MFLVALFYPAARETPPLAAVVGDVVPRPRCPAGAIGRAHQGVAHDAGAN